MKSSASFTFTYSGKAYLFFGLAFFAVASLIPLHGVSAANNARFVGQFGPPSTVCANSTIPINIIMQNTGDTTWQPGQGYALGSQNPRDNNQWGGWIGVSETVAPGQNFGFGTKMVTVPSAPGTYKFQWQMVQDGVEWFGEMTPNITVQVQNCGEAAPSLPQGCQNLKATGSVRGGNATLTVPQGACPITVSFSSYQHQGTTMPFENQTFIANITGTYGPGTHSIGPIKLAPCNWQSDLYYGNVITRLPPGGHEDLTDLIAFDLGEHQQCPQPVGLPANNPPVVNIHHIPQNPFTNEQVTVIVGANDNEDAIRSISVYVDDTLKQTCSSTNVCQTPSRQYALGTHSYYATALDARGAQGTSPRLVFVVSQRPQRQQPNIPPVVSVSHSPQNPTTQDFVTVNANAGDANGIRTIRVYVDGRLRQTCRSTKFCSVSEQQYSQGTHTYYAQAEDNGGETGTSSQQNFFVAQTDREQQTDPQVSVSHSPQNPTTQDFVTVNANAGDANGIRTIRVYVDGRLRQTCRSTKFCSVSEQQYSQGTHTYYAQAEDNGGETGTSFTRNFQVTIAQRSASMAIEFFATPSSGIGSLIGADLAVTVSGTTGGNFTYRFDCTGDGRWDHVVTTANTFYTATDLCNYFNPGIYSAKISVQRGGILVQGSTPVLVR